MARTGNLRLAPEALERFRVALESMQDELRQRLSAERAAEVVQRPDEPLDFGDWCHKSHEEWLFVNRNRLEVALLREIQAALLRLREGAYGLCQECQQPISSKRLDAVPWARCCALCQQQAASVSGRP